MSENSNDPMPASTRKYGFLDYLKVGLVVGFGPFIVGEAFFGGNPNVSAILAGISLALLGWMIVSTARSHRTDKAKEIFGNALGAGLFLAMIMFGSGKTVVEQYQAGEVTAQFAQSDFARLDEHHEGTLSLARLNAVIKIDSDLTNSVNLVERARNIVHDSATGDAAKGITTFEMDLVTETLKAQQLPADLVARTQVVANYACAAGTKAKSGECTVTVNDLLNFRQKTEAQYSLWLTVLRWFHAV